MLPATQATTTFSGGVIAVVAAAIVKIIKYLIFIPYLLCARNFPMYLSALHNDHLR